MGGDRLGEPSGIDLFAEFERRLHHLQVAPWQQHARVGNIAGVAGELDAVFGGAERRGANAFVRRQQRPRESPGRDPLADGGTKPAAHVVKILLLAIIDIFADAAGEHHAGHIAEIDDRVGEIEMFDIMWHRPCR